MLAPEVGGRQACLRGRADCWAGAVGRGPGHLKCTIGRPGRWVAALCASGLSGRAPGLAKPRLPSGRAGPPRRLHSTWIGWALSPRLALATARHANVSRRMVCARCMAAGCCSGDQGLWAAAAVPGEVGVAGASCGHTELLWTGRKVNSVDSRRLGALSHQSRNPTQRQRCAPRGTGTHQDTHRPATGRSPPPPAVRVGWQPPGRGIEGRAPPPPPILYLRVTVQGLRHVKKQGLGAAQSNGRGRGPKWGRGAGGVGNGQSIVSRRCVMLSEKKEGGGPAGEAARGAKEYQEE